MANSVETWYGEIVQIILWQRLGLLMHDGNGCYHILHQICGSLLSGAGRKTSAACVGSVCAWAWLPDYP